MKKEYCCNNGYIKYAAMHLIVELRNAKNIYSIPQVKSILREAVKACGATVLRLDLHKFSLNGGISGVAIIKESHVSIHTWPEYNYVAADLFMCGDTNPYKAIPVLKKGFKPKDMQVIEIKRGLL